MMATPSGVFLWGGETAPPPGGGFLLGDVWAYHRAAGWSRRAPVGGEKDGISYFDAPSGRIVVFVDTGANFSPASENWSYDPVTDRWEERAIGNRPDLFNPTGAYDSGSRRFIEFGGDGTTWAYDYAGNAWKEMKPAVHPDGRYFPAMQYDPVGDRIVLFGGSIDDVGTTETWTYDYDHDTWRNMHPASAPPLRLHGTMTWDPASRTMILFGGEEKQAVSPLGDTWAYDPGKNTWTELTPKPSPPARARQAMAYDEESKTIVMFGGGATPFTFKNDTWIYDPAKNTWTNG